MSLALPSEADIVLIGGGPAGLSLAIALALEGQRVLVLERGEWPRDKVCGEGLMPTGVDALERLGVLKHISEDMQRPFRGITWIDDSGVRAEGDFAEGQGLGVRRLGLSQALRARAEELDGIQLQDRARVTDIAREPDCIRLEVECEDMIRTLRARLVVGADGLRSLVRRALELDGPAPIKQRRWGARQHFRHAPWSDRVEVWWSDGVEAYITPSSDSRVEIAFLWDEARFKLPRTGTQLIEGLLSCFPELQARLAEAEALSNAASIGPLARAALMPVDDRIVLIGDALCYLDGITGEGISVAILAAEAIAPDLTRCLEADELDAQGLAGVGESLDQIYRESFHMTHWAMALTRSTGLRRTVIHGMSRSPELFSHFLESNMARVKPWRMPLNGLIHFLGGMILPRRAPLAGLMPWIALALLALSMRLWMHWALDLRDIPGPAAAISMVRAWMEPAPVQWDVRLIALLHGLIGDIEWAAWMTSMLGSMAEVAGAAMLGWALLGRGGGLGAGLIASIWALCIGDALIVGANPVATGLAWMGIGLCVAGVCAGRRGWPWIVLGAFLAVLGADTKVVVLPVLPLLGAVLIARAPSMRARLGSVSLAMLTVWISWQLLQPESSQQLVGAPRFGLGSVSQGWTGIQDMVTRGHPEGHIELIIGAAIVGGLLPGPRWIARFLFLGFSLGLVLATAAILGPIVKPRYLLPPSLGLVVLAGLGLALLARHIRRIRPQALGLVLVFPLWLGLDTIAFMEGQAQRRSDYAGADGPALPLLPAVFSARYADIPDPMLLGLTARGMVDLRKLLQERPGGAASPMLRDNRHTQAELLAYLEERPFRVLDTRSCCINSQPEDCAEDVVHALDQAGMALILPVQSSHHRRVKPEDEAWLEQLFLAASAVYPEADQKTRWWWVREARGSGGIPPCSAGPSAIGTGLGRRAGDRGG